MGACCSKYCGKLGHTCCCTCCCACCHVLAVTFSGKDCPQNYCVCSKCGPKKRRCCHCRLQPEIPQPHNMNVNKTMKCSDYSQWLDNSEAIQGRKWFYWVTFYVDLYCWLLIGGYIFGTFVAHFIPFLSLFCSDVKSWTTCLPLNNSSTKCMESWKTCVPCVIIIHLMEGTCIVGVVTLCIYILHNWSFDKLDFFEKLLILTNLLTLAMFLFEGSLTWITFIRESPWYQSFALFALDFVLCIGFLLGVFIQYNVCLYIQCLSYFDISQQFEVLCMINLFI